jgi:nucleoside-diphosphate-sugar epimerase
VLLTGGTGFIGRAVRQALRARPERPQVRILTRSAAGRDLPWIRADLADPVSLRGAAADADVLVHLASQLEGDERSCAAVNVRGTQALMDEARRAGVRHIVHLSTAAVYGPGPHRGIEANEIAPAPVSPASRTRLVGERAALEAGAVVLRPGLVVGSGDRWVVPALADLTRRVPAQWEGGNARLSLVAVEDLGRLIAELACGDAELPGGVYHASHPRPVRVRSFLNTLAGMGVLSPVPPRAWSWERCMAEFRQVPGTSSERQFHLLARDHWYRSEHIWRSAAVGPGPGPLQRLPSAAAWYRSTLLPADPGVSRHVRTGM